MLSLINFWKYFLKIKLWWNSKI